MYPVSRLIISSLLATRKPKLAPDGVSSMTFYCRPWDLDMFFEMNNGRVLTLFDLSRFDLSIRTGFARALYQNRWGLAVAGSTIQYRKRVRLFNKVEMRSQLVGIDEKWLFVAQSMWVRGKPTSAALLRTCVTSPSGTVPTRDVLDAMGIETFSPQLPQWAKDWEVMDKTRPWPPQP